MQLSPAKKNSSFLKTRFNIKSHKVLKLKTIQRQNNLDQQHKFSENQNIGRTRINSMKIIESLNLKQKRRKFTQASQQIEPQLSPLKLSPFKQYQSKLKLSSQSWLIYDLKKNQYKRGWKPNRVTHFDGLLKILVLYCYCKLIKLYENVDRVKVKINPDLLKQSKAKQNKKQQKRLQWISASKRNNKTLQKGTIILLDDVIKGMIISGNEDLLQYSVMCCGYILSHGKNNMEGLAKAIDFKKEGEEELYIDIFCRYCNDKILKQELNLQNSKVVNNEQMYQFYSTANQISEIFLNGFRNHRFYKETVSLRKILCFIKFQVGNNYWQDRTITIRNKKQQINSNHFCNLVYKGYKNYDAICYNSSLQILMIIEDSKFSMADLDISVLQNWFINVTKPIAITNKCQFKQDCLQSISPPRKKTNIFSILNQIEF